MNIREEEEKKLFRKWTIVSPKETFVRDGVVHDEEWDNMPIHIVFLLKECNGPCNGDLRGFLNDGGHWKTWNNVSRWTYAIRQRFIKHETPQWNSVKRIYNDTRKYNLRKIAVINVKKQAGTSSTNTSKMIKAFRKDNKPFFVQQLNLLKPIDIIVCCGNGVATCYEECIDEQLRWETIYPRVRKTANKEGTLVIDFFHPQSRQNAQDLFKWFCETLT